MKVCLDCTNLYASDGPRCRNCQQLHESRRVTNNPNRRKYNQRKYRRIRPVGPCQTPGCPNDADTKDHIIPLAGGFGTNAYTNIQFLCRSCNSRKGPRKPTCITKDCENPQNGGRGFCKTCYARHYRAGTLDVFGIRKKAPAKVRDPEPDNPPSLNFFLSQDEEDD
ncbi:HNH endonuclease signature motif containing protein [Actinospongicola halichondriae]|uniref:HNH endonuclease signature motif containing protein n=1 Tax=Actinospongicola halichondriae TaxID=3236844 RepID=UPI003D5CC000